MSKLTVAADKAIEGFEPQLLAVMRELDRRILDVIGSAKLSAIEFDAAVILNSRGAMIEALRDSGYNALVESYISEYENTPAIIKADFDAMKLPVPKFSTADAATFGQIATADLEAFSVIGVKAMDDLRLGLYRQAVSSQPFSVMVDSIAAATIGLDAKGSPLARYAYTYANTAFQSFGGEVARVAGEAIGAELWEVVGPSDNVTRQECLDALADPIRTEKEWQSVGYWGGAPGGWNCRHNLYPVFEG